jgi:hypothetical protein
MTAQPHPEAEDLVFVPEQLQQRLDELRGLLEQDLDVALVDELAVLAQTAIERVRQVGGAGALLDVGRNELTVPLARSIDFKPAFLPPAPWHPSPVPVLVVTLGHPVEPTPRPGAPRPPAWTHFVLQVPPDLEQADVGIRFRAAVERARRLSPT